MGCSVMEWGSEATRPLSVYSFSLLLQSQRHIGFDFSNTRRPTMPAAGISSNRDHVFYPVSSTKASKQVVLSSSLLP
jgi:DNA segregation ATPase FtsK/SpoIIIE-like protein